MPALVAIVGYRLRDGNGDPLPGAKLYAYLSETLTPIPLFYDVGMTVPSTWPAVADSGGLFPDLYAATPPIRVELTDAGGNSVLDIDPYISGDFDLIERLADLEDRALKVPTGETPVADIPNAATRALKVLAFDALGAPTVAAGANAGALIDLSNATYLNPTTGGVAMPAILKLHGTTRASVKEWGVQGNGTTDDTANLQKAANSGDPLWIPNGTYKITGGIHFGSDADILGESRTGARIQRSGVWAEDTFSFGDVGNPCGSPEVRRFLLEQLHPGYQIGNTTLADKLTGGQSHIKAWSAFRGKFEDLYLQYAPYGITMLLDTASEIRGIHSFSVYDPVLTALQESLAIIYLQSIPTHIFNTETRIEGCYIGGGGGSANRTQTVGSDISFSAPDAIGSKYGILVEGVEGLSIGGCGMYIGGTAVSNIAFVPKSTCAMISIDNIFLDGTNQAAIDFLEGTGGNVTNICNLGPGIRANGQGQTRNHIRVANGGGSVPTVFGLNVQGGQYAYSLEAAMRLTGLKGAVISNPIVNAYNYRGSANISPLIAAGVYCGGSTDRVHVNGGLFGGSGVFSTGTPPALGMNNARWGVYSDASVAAGVTVSGVRGVMGLGSGSLTNINGTTTQTYP